MAETFSKSDKKNYKFIDLRNSPYPKHRKKDDKNYMILHNHISQNQ